MYIGEKNDKPLLLLTTPNLSGEEELTLKKNIRTNSLWLLPRLTVTLKRRIAIV